MYLQALARALEQGHGGIVLVPEISLTPQTVERFKARFSSGPLQTLVAVLHSHLSAGERHDEWHKIRQGRARVVIGARSAIFAPVDPLGLIIVDEEHEHTYKQEEAPRYHARDVAIVRGQMEGATVVLGSATPLWRATTMPTRQIHPPGHARAGRQHQAAGGPRGGHAAIRAPRTGHSCVLAAIEGSHRTTAGTQGANDPLPQPARLFHLPPMHAMRLCGDLPELQRVAHISSPGADAVLPRMRAYEPVPALCPNDKCRNPAIRYSGLGTERVEDTLAKLFPDARIQRMDSDTLKRKDDYRRILGDFRTGKTDILVGTQMIAKGLHFPNVTLVGIICADLALHLPDFRAGERTFQLLTQVAGRAGRGDIEGEVVVQSFTPFHPAIQFARRHDFDGFYEQEIQFREHLRYPPICRAALLTLKGRNEDKVKLSAEHLRRELEKALTEVKDLVIAGPAPAPLARAESNYRYQVMLRARQMTVISRRLAVLTESLALPDDVTLSVDIDPVDLA